jgi:hypothetical protein
MASLGIAIICLALATLFGFAFFSLAFQEKAPFLQWRGISIPRLVLLAVGSIIPAMFMFSACTLLVICWSQYRRRGCLVLTRDALLLPDDLGKVQHIPFTSIIALQLERREYRQAGSWVVADRQLIV